MPYTRDLSLLAGDVDSNGNDIHDDECSNKCTLPGCGDGILHADEECDEASDDCVACKRSSMRVFVTSAAVLPVLGGLMGADATCQQAADQAGVQGRFRAWLSTKDVSAHNRLVHSARPYMRLDGEIVATHWADLIDGSLFAAISVDETGKSVPAQMGCGVCPVWTATYTNGAAYMDSCTNWGMLSALTSAGVGECSFQNQQWTDGCGTLACNKTARLYCLEQGLAP